MILANNIYGVMPKVSEHKKRSIGEEMGNQIATNQELLVSNMLEIQALIRILERKGITNKDEILEKVKKLQVEMEEKVKKMGREN